MNWAAERLKMMLWAYVGLASCFLIARLIQVSGSWHVWSRDAATALFMSGFGFVAVWLILGAQVGLRGMDRVVRGGCAFFFYMSAFCALWSLVISAAHPDYWAIAAVSSLGSSLGALHTYVRYRHTPPKGRGAI